MLQAILYADDLNNQAPYTGMSPEQIDRRYAEWMVEFIHEKGWKLEPMLV